MSGLIVGIDDERFAACVRGKTLTLTPVELRLLNALIARPGRVVLRAQLRDAA